MTQTVTQTRKRLESIRRTQWIAHRAESTQKRRKTLRHNAFRRSSYLHTQEVTGSSPAVSTKIPPHLRRDFSLPKFLPDSGSMTYTRVRKQALCVLETDRRASVRTGAAMTIFSVFADTTSYFSSSCASVTRPLTPTPMYTTCRATSPDILRLSRVPIHSPASMHTMLTPATGSSSARK